MSDIVAADEPTFLLGGGLSEGPVWHPAGFVTFVRLQLSQLVRWDSTGASTVLRTDTGKGNGCTLDLSGRLLMCEGEHRKVTRAETDGSLSTVSDSWQGKALNRPSDIVTRSDGSVFFTDPNALVPPEEREMDFSGIFCVTPAGETILATSECEYPNGLAFSPDETTLYVAITRLDARCITEIDTDKVCTHRRLRAFDVATDGRLTNNRIFADMSSAGPGSPDGIKVDTDGRIYCAGARGIWVFDPAGVRIALIPTPEQPRNLCFGGPDGNIMYITAGDSLYALPTRVRGLGIF